MRFPANRKGRIARCKCRCRYPKMHQRGTLPFIPVHWLISSDLRRRLLGAPPNKKEAAHQKHPRPRPTRPPGGAPVDDTYSAVWERRGRQEPSESRVAGRIGIHSRQGTRTWQASALPFPFKAYEEWLGGCQLVNMTQYLGNPRNTAMTQTYSVFPSVPGPGNSRGRHAG